MRIAHTVAATLVAAGAAAVVLAPTAAADNYPTVHRFGTPEQLVDGAGTVVQGWTISDLRPSTDVVAWPVRGHLWEATGMVTANRGTVTPIITDFNARAASGQTYEALPARSTHGISPATLGQGGHSGGKLYFDVIGAPPSSVVYDAGGRDLLIWV